MSTVLKRTILGLAIAQTCVIAAPAFAADDAKETPVKVALDYRYEYIDKKGVSNDRFKTFITKGPLALEIEARGTYGTDDYMEHHRLSTYDVGAFYIYRVNPNLVVVPGFDYIISSNNTEYVPSLRVNYKTDAGIRLQTRYKQILNEETDSRVQRTDFWLGYGTKIWDVQYQVSFGHQLGNDKPLGDGNQTDYWQNIRLRYQEHQLQPYVELGDIKVSPTTDERQMRYRVGIMYRF